MSKSNTKKRNQFRQCWTLPKDMVKHENFMALSANAVKLLIDILTQYNGTNNGNMCAALKLLSPRGWNCKRKLMNARRELEHYRFLRQTKQGGRTGPTLYAVTFFAIDWCGGIHFETPTDQAPDDWSTVARAYETRYPNPKFKGIKNANGGCRVGPVKSFPDHPYNQRNQN